MMTYDFLILGAGAGGLMAAIAAGEAGGGEEAQRPLRIAILEKNSRPGIKILVCGGGRCNLTNAGDQAFLIKQFGRNGRFLAPALSAMDNEGLRDWFAQQGVPTHEEHDGKIYPDSNQAQSVVDALVRRARELGVEMYAEAQGGAAAVEVNKLSETEGTGFAVRTADGREFTARNLLLAVGGQSYTKMGTTGDGYRFAAKLGHQIHTPRPAIVGLLYPEEWIKPLQGLAVRDVEVRIDLPAGETGKGGGKGGGIGRASGKVEPSINDILFTHFGLSGPAVLNPSEVVAELLEKYPEVILRIDFARHYTHDQLRQTFKDWQQHQGKKLLRKILCQGVPEITIQANSPDQSWSNQPQVATNVERETSGGGSGGGVRVPRRLAEAFCQLCGIGLEQTCANLSAAQMHALVERLKGTGEAGFRIKGTRGFKEAMVTAGGVMLAEVDPKSMESKLVRGLFFAGEMLDLTGPSGGYNLQMAFSTGYLAGKTVAEQA